MLETELHSTDIKSFLEFINEKYRYDFREYAATSLKRRLERLLTINNFKNLTELKNKIIQQPTYAEEVAKEITVNTTEMFRDPSFWRVLKKDIIPQIDKSPTIKIWHAACSSGEEVYSMCILLKEAGVLDRAVIYATDLNEKVLSVAKQGVYNKRNMELNEGNYTRFEGIGKLSDYYTEHDINYIQFNPELIKNVTFRKHDLVNGATFSKFDLILCRNVLIYFNFALQEKVVQLFEQSLFSRSFLAIGSKELINLQFAPKNVNIYSLEEKIYQKI